jgi:hypothetical protein
VADVASSDISCLNCVSRHFGSDCRLAKEVWLVSFVLTMAFVLRDVRSQLLRLAG